MQSYKASFTVDSDNEDEGSWQQFPESEFATRGAASANALRAARISIDLHAWRRPAMSHFAWMIDGANLPVEPRLGLDAVALYGADARAFGARRDSNPYPGSSLRIKSEDASETWRHACAWDLGWNSPAQSRG